MPIRISGIFIDRGRSCLTISTYVVSFSRLRHNERKKKTMYLIQKAANELAAKAIKAAEAKAAKATK